MIGLVNEAHFSPAGSILSKWAPLIVDYSPLVHLVRLPTDEATQVWTHFRCSWRNGEPLSCFLIYSLHLMFSLKRYVPLCSLVFVPSFWFKPFSLIPQFLTQWRSRAGRRRLLRSDTLLWFFRLSRHVCVFTVVPLSSRLLRWMIGLLWLHRYATSILWSSRR